MVYLFLSVLALLVVGIAIAAIPFFRETEQKRREWEQKQKRDRELRELREAEAKKQEEEKRWDNSFEIQQLLKQARGTAKERTPEARENIVTLKLTGSFSSSRIKATEHKLLKEYTKFISRPDIEKIKKHYPEIMIWKREPLVLLELAKNQREEESRALEMQQSLQKEERWTKEIQKLLTEAQATTFKRTPEMREKIVSLGLDDILSREAKILQEYTEFMKRSDIKKIEERYPEIIAWQSEPVVLLKLAWEKLEHKTETPIHKETPEEYRERTLKNRTAKAKDKQETIKALLREKLDEKLSLRQFEKEAETIIDEYDSLTEEDREELIDYIKEISQSIMQEGDEPQELM